MTVYVEKLEEEVNTKAPEMINQTIFLTMPKSEMLNDGTLADQSEWFFKHQKLPIIRNGQQIVINATFDAVDGGLGLDNIQFHTPQR